jgi:8-oxo-dGTP diphosphatase
LRRELAEELGIHVHGASPLHRVPFALGGRPALLEGWLIDRDWGGLACAREGQPVGWVATGNLPDLDWLPADRPLAVAVDLPRLVAITPDARDARDAVASLEAAIRSGAGLLVLRLPSLDPDAYATVASAALRRCRPIGVRVLGHGDPTLVERLGLDGVHLPASRVRDLRTRPLPPAKRVTAACHDVGELLAAVRIGCDAVLVSPVAPTPTHPAAPALGWEGFARLAARSPLPAYGLGGLGPADLAQARSCGGFGIAGIRGFAV